jgi:hypothetical protein
VQGLQRQWLRPLAQAVPGLRRRGLDLPVKCFLCSRFTVLRPIRQGSVRVTACWRHRNQGKVELQRRLAKGGRYQHRKLL